jgi:hypothetical protein
MRAQSHYLVGTKPFQRKLFVPMKAQVKLHFFVFLQNSHDGKSEQEFFQISDLSGTVDFQHDVAWNNRKRAFFWHWRKQLRLDGVGSVP